MGAGNRKCREESRPSDEDLEEWVRLKVQGFVQEVLEEEVVELLGLDSSRQCRSSGSGTCIELMKERSRGK